MRQTAVTFRKEQFQEIKKTLKLTLESNFLVGGVGGIRTHARGKPSNDLANRPLQPA